MRHKITMLLAGWEGFQWVSPFPHFAIVDSLNGIRSLISDHVTNLFIQALEVATPLYLEPPNCYAMVHNRRSNCPMDFWI